MKEGKNEADRRTRKEKREIVRETECTRYVEHTETRHNSRQ